MDVEKIRNICLGKPGTTEDMKWGDHLCFCVAGKIYLILGMDDHPVTASVKVTDDEFETWSRREGFVPAPYMARNKWVKMDDLERLGEKEWRERIEISYDIIRSKLPKKIQASL
ncbi:MAG: MmcQ/YjbR family DNA-binding protein [Flavobacteriales bacterium]|nr:MmcQ/YjbR family DNA-binding protein [Flavobacteriales bacterium]